MKKRIYFSIVVVLIFLFACQPPVVFDKPQPDGVSAISGFPAKLQGLYLSSDDSSFLEITPDAVIRKYDFDTKVHLSQLDSNFQIIGDTLFNTKTNLGSLAQIEGDSILMHVNERDTLFTIDSLNVLKRFKGYYFINIYTSPSWEVKKLELSRYSLTLSSITKKEDIDQLKAITEASQDSIPYVFSPTRRQFKEFVRNEGFRNIEKFTKIRN
jgi:hypothetical protein